MKTLLSKIKEFILPKPFSLPENIAIKISEDNRVDGENIVTFSTQDWSDLWTRKQRFVLQFARQGNRVLYVETQFHWVSYIKQFRKHWRRIYLFLFGPRKVEEDLYIYTPPLLLPAFQVFPFLAKINNFVLSLHLKKVLKNLTMTEPVLWLYTHYNKPLVKMLGARKALYECVDDYSSAKGLIKADTVKTQEKETLNSVEAVIVTADSLKNIMTLHNRNVHIISNAANITHFNKAFYENLTEPKEIINIEHPRLVFMGMLQYWIDQNLLAHIAKSHPEWQIIIIGPVVVDVTILRDYDNIHFIGRVEYDLLPKYFAHSDIALNPYKVDGVAEGCSPLKLYEYLAAGLPVVSTEMPEASKFDGIVKIAHDYDQFISHCLSILELKQSELHLLKREAVRISSDHSWENRFKSAESVLKGVLK